LLKTLKQPAIDHQALVVVLDKVFRSGDGTDRSQECDFHPLPSVSLPRVLCAGLRPD
jgi:hypothetical protein